jgi:hypothetical protein
VIPGNLSDRQDVLLDDLLVYVCLGPQRVEDFFVRHQATGVLDQVAEHVECFRRDRDAPVAAPKALIECVEPKRVKQLHANRSPVTPTSRGIESTATAERGADHRGPRRTVTLFADRDRTRCRTADQLAPATTDCPASMGIAVADDRCVTRLTAYSGDGGAPAIRLSLSRARLRRDITVPIGTPRSRAISS